MSIPIPELIDELYRDRVRRAREMKPEDKFLAGPQLFAFACRIAKDGIRSQYPDADEQRVAEILRERLRIAARLEEL